MAQNYLLLIESADHIVWDSRVWRPKPKLYVTVTLDLGNNPVSPTPVFKRSLQPEWNFKSNLLCPSTSTITLRLYDHTFLPHREDPVIGECRIGIEELLRQCGAGGVVQLEVEADSKVSGRLSVLLEKSEAAPATAEGRMESTLGTLTVPGLGLDRIDAAVEAGGAQSDLATALGACLDRVKVVVEMVDQLAQVHPYVSAAWRILTAVYKAVEQQREMDDKVVELIKTMVEVYSFTEDINFVVEKIKILEDTLIKIAKQTLECAKFLEEYRQHGFSGRAFQTVFLNKHGKRIEELSTDLVKLREAFDHALSTQILSHTTRLGQFAALEKLRHISYDASLRTGCLPGTREDILANISSWLMTPSGSSNILWLSGVAGSGKSSIATSLSEHFRKQNCLSAFLFFTRNSLANSNPTAVLHTMAYRLAELNGHFRDALCTVIQQKPDILDVPIHSQFEALLRGPLLSVQPHMEKPVIIILDALDECSDTDWRSTLISLITADFPTLPANFRFLITSRPDGDITRPFRHAQDKITPQTLSIEPGGDVALYIQSRFKDIQEDHDLPKEWPGSSAIKQLVECSGGLFIWATTACNLIQGCFDPEEKLEVLLAQEFKAESQLDEIYTIALQSSGLWTRDSNFVLRACGILACIVLGRAPLEDKAMDSLLSLKPGTASKVLAFLGCVIYCAGDGTARVLHASFSDYLMDPDRSGTHLWNIQSKMHHHSLALGCFHVLGSQLKFNICHLEDSYLLNSEVADLPTRLHTYLSPELCYASQYWVNHLCGAEPTEAILDKLRELLEKHFLYWLEVISLRGQVQGVSEMLTIAWNYAAKSGSDDLKFLLHDAQRFVDGFAPVIAQSAPHIYVSALPLAPKKSRVQRNFGAKFPGVLKYTSPDGHWLSLQKTLTGHSNRVSSVTFSPDGRRIVSGSDDKTIRIWDSETGAALGGPLTGHSVRVRSVAFSPDGRQIVSGSSDDTIRIWDSDTGAALGGPLTGHGRAVHSVAFSPDGRRIVSGSDDNTIQIWDSETRAALGAPLTGHDRAVNSVAFSPDGRQIVSGSSDDTIRIWNSETGAALGAPLTGHRDTVCSVVFSPDGSRIISGSYNDTICIWNAETGAVLSAPLTGHRGTVYSVAFSSDGRRIVSGSSDDTIRIWDSVTGAALGGPLTGHGRAVNSVAFSPDGRRIVSGSDDNTIRIWDSETRAAPGAPLTGHSGTVCSVAFSPDGRQIVSGSSDDTIRIWDSDTGAALGAPLTGHGGTVNSVAVSPNGRQIASGSSDDTIRIWDSETRAALGASLTGHSNTVSSVAFSPDGRQIVSGSNDKTIRIWDSETGAALGTPLTGHGGTVKSVAFSPNGRQIVSGSSDYTIRIWDSDTGMALGAPLTGHHGIVFSVAFSPDGRRIVSGSSDKTIRIWDSATGAALGAPLTGHSKIVCLVAFSTDGTRIVSGSDDNTIRIWDSETGVALSAPLTGHSRAVNFVAFSPDGRRIVSGSDDKTIRIWDVETHAALSAPLTGRSNTVSSVSGSDANIIPIWDSEIKAAIGEHHFPSSFVSNDNVETSQMITTSAMFTDGWVTDSLSHRLVWVPAWLRDHFCGPPILLVITPNGLTTLNLTRFVHGIDWVKCIDA